MLRSVTITTFPLQFSFQIDGIEVTVYLQFLFPIYNLSQYNTNFKQWMIKDYFKGDG